MAIAQWRAHTPCSVMETRASRAAHRDCRAARGRRMFRFGFEGDCGHFRARSGSADGVADVPCFSSSCRGPCLITAEAYERDRARSGDASRQRSYVERATKPNPRNPSLGEGTMQDES